MGRADYYKPGSYNAICYECGFKFKAEMLMKYWQGYFLCPRCWNERQPQDFARGIPDVQTPPWSQPQPAWQFGLDEFITEDSATNFIAPNFFVTEDGSVNYLNLPGASGDYASTPDSAVLDIAGDIEFIVYAAAYDWTRAATQSLIGKVDSGANQRSYRLDIGTNGKPIITTSTDGTISGGVNSSSTVVVPFADGAGGWLKATLDVNDGSGNRVATFYYSYDSPSTALANISWTTMDTVTLAGTTSIFDGTAALTVGAITNGTVFLFAGKIYSAYVYNGIGGTLVASFNPSWALAASTSFTSKLTNEVWSVNGNATILASPGTLSQQPFCTEN